MTEHGTSGRNGGNILRSTQKKRWISVDKKINKISYLAIRLERLFLPVGLGDNRTILNICIRMVVKIQRRVYAGAVAIYYGVLRKKRCISVDKKD